MLKTLIWPSFRLGMNGLVGRRIRTTLLGSVVALAASLVVAISCSIRSVQLTVENQLEQTLGAADARIIHLFQGHFREELLETVQSWDDVDLAIGRYSGSLTLTPDEAPDSPESHSPKRVTPLAHGVNLDREFLLRPLALSAGRYPTSADEVLIDAIVAHELDVKPGDVLQVQRFGPVINLLVSGVFERPVIGVLQRPQVIVSRVMLEEATGRSGQLSDIAIRLDATTNIDAFCARHQNVLPEELSLEPAEMARTGFDRRLAAADLMFLLLSVFAFLSASYIIVIGMTTGVSERRRELAILRCIGANRAQIFLSQLWQGMTYGVIGAIVGIPLGVGLAAVLVWRFRDLMIDGLAIGWLGVALAGVGSLAAGLAGAIVPAIAAARVPPLTALQSRARGSGRSAMVIVLVVAFMALGVQLAMLLPDDPSVRFWLYVLIGLPLVQIAYYLLAIPVFVFVVHVIGRVVSRMLGLPGALLPQSAMSIPYRLGMTAGALMIGIGLLVAAWTSTGSLLKNWLGQMQFADGFVYSRNGISAEARARLEDLPFTSDLVPIAYLPLRVQNRHIFGVEGLAPPNVICIGFDPVLFFEVNRVNWVAGDPEEAIRRVASGEGILVAEAFLTSRGIDLGDSLELGAGRLTRSFEIVGVVSAAGLDVATQMFGIRDAYHEHAISCVFADFSTIADTFDHPDVYLVQLNIDGHVTDEEARAQIAQVLPGTLFVSGRDIKKGLDEIGRTLLTINSTVAFAALLLASFAVGGVLMANVVSRQFEYAVLRAVGGTRAHLVRLILGEALLLGLTAIVVGTMFGFHTALMDAFMRRDLLGLDPALVIPWRAIMVGWLVLIVMALLAALPAAYRIATKHPRELLSMGRAGA